MSVHFPNQSYQTWIQQFAKELKTEAPEERLKSQYQDINVEAYYAYQSGLASFPEENRKPFQPEFSFANNWDSQISIPTDDLVKANRLALSALEQGATSIRFTGNHISTQEELILVLKDIQLDAISIQFDADEANQSLFFMWLNELDKRKLSPSKNKVLFCIDPLIDRLFNAELGQNVDEFDVILDTLAKVNNDYENSIPFLGVSAYQLVSAGSYLSFELAAALSVTTEYWHRSKNPEKFVLSTYWQLSVSSHYLPEIAKFRAARLLWSALTNSFGLNNSKLHLQALVLPEYYTLYEPHSNLLRASVAGMAACVGGADLINIPQHTALSELYDKEATRRAIHIQQLMRYESHLDKAQDVMKGSSYIEHLTSELASKAWSEFQTMEKMGGWLACVKSGYVKDKVQQQRKDQETNINSGKEKYIGIHHSIDLNQKAEKELRSRLASYHTPSPEHLSKWRRTEEMEYLRSSILDHQIQAIPLILFDNDKIATARFAFCETFLAAGGLKAQKILSEQGKLTPNQLEQISQAPVMILCAANPQYDSFLTQIKEQNTFNSNIFIAGLPENSQVLKLNGANDFIYQGCNQIEKLKAILTYYPIAINL